MPGVNRRALERNTGTVRYAYFCQYGLRAKPYEPAGFTPPEIGTFMHYVLERTAREVKERGGFAAVDDTAISSLTEKYVREYVHTELEDFREKSPRFVYLFRRLTETARRVVLDTAWELRKSDFRPLDFELNSILMASRISPRRSGALCARFCRSRM